MMKINPTPTLKLMCALLSANFVLGKNSSSRIIGMYTALGKLADTERCQHQRPRFQSIRLSGRDISAMNSEQPKSENTQ